MAETKAIEEAVKAEEKVVEEVVKRVAPAANGSTKVVVISAVVSLAAGVGIYKLGKIGMSKIKSLKKQDVVIEVEPSEK